MQSDVSKLALALLLTKSAAPKPYADQTLAERAAELRRVYEANRQGKSKRHADYVMRRMAQKDPEAFHRFYFTQGEQGRARFMEEQARAIQQRQGTAAAQTFLERMGKTDPKARALLGQPAAPSNTPQKKFALPGSFTDPGDRPHRYVRPSRRPSRIEAEQTAKLLGVVRENPGAARQVIALAQQSNMPWLEQQVRAMAGMQSGPPGPGSLKEALSPVHWLARKHQRVAASAADRLGLMDVPWRRDAAAQMDPTKWRHASVIATKVTNGDLTPEQAVQMGKAQGIPWLVRQYGGTPSLRGLPQAAHVVKGAIPWYLGGADYEHAARKQLGQMRLAQGDASGYPLAHPIQSRIFRNIRSNPFVGPEFAGRQTESVVNRYQHALQQNRTPQQTGLPLDFFAGMGTGLPENLPVRAPDGGFEPLPTYQGGPPPDPPNGPAPIWPRYSL